MAIRPFHKVYPRASHYGHSAVSQGINFAKLAGKFAETEAGIAKVCGK